MNGIKQENQVNVALHEHQLRAMQSDRRFILLVAGTQGGKTTLGKYWMAREINEHPEDEYLVACPTYKIMGQSTLPRLVEVLKQMRCGEWNEQRKEYRLNGGGRVYVRSTEDPDSIESMKCRAVWLDEVGKMKVRVWYAVNSRIAILKGRVLMTTSPYNMGWIYQEIFRKGKEDSDYEIIQFASNANPWYPQEEWERQRRTLPEVEFKRRFCGEFIKAEGLVYKTFNSGLHVYDSQTTELPKELYKFIGLDIGYTNPTAAIFCGIDKDGTIWVYDEYYATQTLLGSHVEAIKEKYKSYWNESSIKDTKIWADKSAAQEIMELNYLGLNVAKNREIDVNVGIDKVQRLFKQGKIKISDKCKYLIDELETYSWRDSEDTEDKKDKVIKKKDHAVDAFRYGVTSTSFMYPDFRNEEQRSSRLDITYDEEMGTPIEYKSNEDSLIRSSVRFNSILMSDGTRVNMNTGKREKNNQIN